MTSTDVRSSPGSLARPTTVLQRFLALLGAVKDADGACTTADLVAITGMPKSTVFRLVSELVEHRYLARVDGGVVLGLRLFELGSCAVLPRRLLSIAAPAVRGLSQRTGERVGLWVQQGLDMVSVAAVQGRLPMLSAHAGMRSPALTTASGKAYLAFCADQSVVDRVSASLVDREADRFRDELLEIRTSELATDLGLSYRGVVAVASPIIAPDSTVLGAISVAGPSDGMRVDRVASLVRTASLTLSQQFAATA